MSRIYLSPPDVGAKERELLLDAFDSGWIAPLGPHVDAFEAEIAGASGRQGALATSSGTAALHLALDVCGVGAGDVVLCSDLTFVASANPILYIGATPVFVGSERASWCMDANAFEDAVKAHRPKAAIVVDLYGQCPDYAAILAIAESAGVVVIEDSAEALGSSHQDRPAGSFGRLGVFSFNGNKIITTSSGGMLVGDDDELLAKARHLATQAREPVIHYEHQELGYNYRMSNLLAAVGRGQLAGLPTKVARRRAIFERYDKMLGGVPGITMQAEAPNTVSNRWLTCLTIDEAKFGASCHQVIAALGAADVEARPLWKPMHMQPLYHDAVCVGPEVGAELFARGLCLPSGSSLSNDDVDRIAGLIVGCSKNASARASQ